MESVEDCNLFMMCRSLCRQALSDIPEGYHVRLCRQDELELWYAFPYDEGAQEHRAAMARYFDAVYRPYGDAFWRSCLFVCDAQDTPVGTCFAWKAYGCVTTIHWFKVRRDCEGRGLGRGLLSHVMRALNENDFPVFLHTQPGSFRAIKLYTDMGFALLTDPEIGYRPNELEAGLPFLRAHMPPDAYARLRFERAPEAFLQAVRSSRTNEF